MADCIFCKIVQGDIPSDKVYEDDEIYGFRDINPEAPVHVLVIPKKHINGLNGIEAEDEPVLGRMMTVIRDMAEAEGIAKSGYRVLTNSGPDGGQVVDHLHFHLLGGKKLGKIG